VSGRLIHPAFPGGGVDLVSETKPGDGGLFARITHLAFALPHIGTRGARDYGVFSGFRLRSAAPSMFVRVSIVDDGYATISVRPSTVRLR